MNENINRIKSNTETLVLKAKIAKYLTDVYVNPII